jgi:hypothetical protein
VAADAQADASLLLTANQVDVRVAHVVWYRIWGKDDRRLPNGDVAVVAVVVGVSRHGFGDIEDLLGKTG